MLPALILPASRSRSSITTKFSEHLTSSFIIAFLQYVDKFIEIFEHIHSTAAFTTEHGREEIIEEAVHIGHVLVTAFNCAVLVEISTLLFIREYCVCFTNLLKLFCRGISFSLNVFIRVPFLF